MIFNFKKRNHATFSFLSLISKIRNRLIKSPIPRKSVKVSDTTSKIAQTKNKTLSQYLNVLNKTPDRDTAREETPKIQVIATQIVSHKLPIKSIDGLYTKAKGTKNPARES